MIPILVESLISFKCNCRHHNFLVRCTSTTSDQPRTFKCAQARCKTCPFIKNVEEIKQSIKITDHFTCTTVISYDCITCTLCKKLYDSETGRQLSDQFWEDLRDIKKDDKNVSNRLREIFISPVILSNIWQSAAFPYIKEAWKATKLRTNIYFSSLDS